MVKLTNEQYLAYRKAHACPIPKEDLEAQMFIGYSTVHVGNKEFVKLDNDCKVEVGDFTGDIPVNDAINGKENVFTGYERCSQPGCTGLSENVKYSEDSSKYNTML